MQYQVIETPEKTEWYVRELLHREDGPAVIYIDGTEEYWLTGVQLDKKCYEEKLNIEKNSSNFGRKPGSFRGREECRSSLVS